jgi:hypothetical protein
MSTGFAGDGFHKGISCRILPFCSIKVDPNQNHQYIQTRPIGEPAFNDMNEMATRRGR